MNGGQAITWSSGGYGGSIIANLVQNVGGYIALNALQGSTIEVLRAQYVNGVGPSCSFSAPVLATSVTVNNDFICNSGIMTTSTSSPANINYIGYTNTLKLTNSIALSSGYTLLSTFSSPVAGAFSFNAQLRLEWVVGQAQWNQVVYGISLNSNSWDADCLYGAFERNPRVDATRGTDCLTTNRVLYVAASTPVNFIVFFSGGTGNFATASNAFTFLRYTRIA